MIGLLVILREFQTVSVPADLWWDYALAGGLCGIASIVIPAGILINRWKRPPRAGD